MAIWFLFTMSSVDVSHIKRLQKIYRFFFNQTDSITADVQRDDETGKNQTAAKTIQESLQQSDYC